ncbi:MAG: DUF192 domain-containing protein [Longimicrobiales bacterium]
MKSVRIINRTRDSVLGSRVGLADGWWLRVRGFLRRPEPQHGEGLLLSPCRAVHMIGMAYPLDVIFLDRHGRVVAQYANLAPGKSTSWHARAKYALELPKGTIVASQTQPGDHVVWLMAETEFIAEKPVEKPAGEAAGGSPQSLRTGATTHR